MTEQTPPPYEPPAPNGEPGGNSGDERTWAAAAHIAAYSAIPLPWFGAIVGPLVVWLIQRPKSPFIDAAGKEAINFNITWSIWFAISFVLWLIGIGIIISAILGVMWLILVGLAAYRTSNGQQYRYPLTIRFLQ